MPQHHSGPVTRRISRAVVGMGLAAVLTVGLAGPSGAQGAIEDLQRQIEEAQRQQRELSDEISELGDQQSGLERQGGDLSASLEGLDADISAKVTELTALQEQLPGAQQALRDAESRVSAASAEVQSLRSRVDQAESNRAGILEEIAAGEEELVQARDEIGQIANQAYKQGGVSSDLAFLLGMSDSSLPEAMGLANQALRIQNGRMSQVSQRTATGRNAEARLAAVEEQIRTLQGQAEQALAREQQAREQAAEAKRDLDTMVADTTQITDELKAQRPLIQQQIAQNRAEQQQVNDDIAARQRQLVAAGSAQSDLQRRHQAAVEEAERKRRAAEEAARKAREAAEAARKAREAQERAAAEQARAARERAEQQARAAREAQERADREAQEAAEADRRALQAAEAERAAQPSSAWGLQLPLNTYITSGFGWRSTPAGSFDYGGVGGYVHTGVDFGGGCGLPVRAASSGKVWNADSAVWSSGNRVVLSHGVVNGRALATKYHHLTRYTVSPGQTVEAGQVIGYSGSTGNSTGCHLHFETILDGAAVDPLGLF